MKLSRRCLLGGLALLPRAARAAPLPITVVGPLVSELTSIDVLNAKAGGHFAAQGLDATLVGSGTGVGAFQQLVAGRCQFVRGGAIELIRAVARQDVPILAIANSEHAVTYVLLSAPDRPIREPAMLQGKRIGLFTLGSTTDNYLALMLHQAGLPLDTVERQAVGANPAAFQLVRQGRLDAIMLPYEAAWPITHPDSGTPDAVVLPVSVAAPMPGRCYLTSRVIAETDPALALAFTRAMAASMQELIAGPVAPLIARCAAAFDMPGLGPMARSEAIVTWITGTWLAGGPARFLRNDAAAWRAGIEGMAAAGLATVPPDAVLYTNRFVDQALAR